MTAMNAARETKAAKNRKFSESRARAVETRGADANRDATGAAARRQQRGGGTAGEVPPGESAGAAPRGGQRLGDSV